MNKNLLIFLGKQGDGTASDYHHASLSDELIKPMLVVILHFIDYFLLFNAIHSCDF